jgi:hypothetical protein
MCLIFESPAPVMPNICRVGSQQCILGWVDGSYGEHDPVRDEGFEGDAHGDCRWCTKLLRE